MDLSERLKRLHELAHRTHQAERALSDAALENLREGNAALARRLRQRRIDELRWSMMTEGEKADHLKLQDDVQKDFDEQEWTA